MTRRDFVALVKLLRDLLSETSRLRLLVNRVQLEPPLAYKLRELDAPASVTPTITVEKTLGQSASSAATTLLAPISRLLGGQAAEQPSTSDSVRPSLAQSRRGGSSTVSTATVNVEYGGGAVRAAESVESPKSQAVASPRDATTSVGRPRQVRRELSSIFAGASYNSTASRRTTPAGVRSQGIDMPAQPRAVPTNRFVSAAASAASSYMPFGRILASYRPAMSSTANAVIDSIPHAPPVLDSPFDDDDEDHSPPSTLLERQLRPRGLSDSSIRSSFTTHGGFSRPNPHHRVVTAAGLALSAETKPVPMIVAPGDSSLDRSGERDAAIAAMSSSPASLGAAMNALRQKLEEDEAETAHALAEGKTISRRASRAQLRGRTSTSRLRESSTLAVSPPPPVPPLPDDLRLSTSTATSDSSLTLPCQTSPCPAITIDEVPAPSAAPAPAPISISPSSRSGSVGPKEKEGGTTSLFGTVVSSAFGSLIGSGSLGGGDKRASTSGSHGPADNWKDRNRFG